MTTCPKCGSENAYIGMNSVECINPKCGLYSETLKEEVDSGRVTPVMPMHQYVSTDNGEDFTDPVYWEELMLNHD